jgi:hypothetical protein
MSKKQEPDYPKAQTLIEKKVLKPEEFKRQMSERDRSRYEEQPNGTYRCRKCKTVILAARVAHPIWDGPFPMSGSGRCLYVNVPYCPNCEQKPDSRGLPIAPKGSYHNP